MKALLTAALLCLLPLPTLAINKCVGADGRVTYTDETCPNSSKQTERLAETPQPRPEDVKRAQEETSRIKEDLRRSEERRAQEQEKRALTEREAQRDRERQELLDLERRKVEALENQTRLNANPVPIIVMPERHAPRRYPVSPPTPSQSQPREARKNDIPFFGPRLPPR